MSSTEDLVDKCKLSSLASTLSNEEFQQFIISKMKWFVQNKELTVSFVVKNDNSNDLEKDISKIGQIIRNRNNDMSRKTRVKSLDELPDVLICEISSFLPIQEYFSLANTAKVFFILLNNKKGTHLSELDTRDFDNNWSSKQFEKQLYRHRNLQTLTVLTNQLISNDEDEMDFKFKKLRHLEVIIEGEVNLSNKSLIESKHLEYKNIVSLSLHDSKDSDDEDIMQIKHILSKCSDLSSLTLFDFKTETSQTINWVINEAHDVVLPRLVELNLWNSVGLALIIKFAHQLKKLFWYNVWSWTANWYPISHCQRFVYLKNCNFAQLQQLCIDAVHYKDLDAILTTAKNIKKIEMTNGDHYYEHESEKNLRDLVNLVFIKCNKLMYFKLWLVKMKSTTKNSAARAYDGIVEGLQDTNQVERDAFVMKLNLILSLEDLKHIAEIFKLSKTKKMEIFFRGELYHHFECIIGEQGLYRQLDYNKEKPLKLINGMLQKLFHDDDDDDGLVSFNLIEISNYYSPARVHIQLTLTKNDK